MDRCENRDPSLWQFILSDRETLGFVRLAIVMLAVFVIASVPALVVAGRWLKGFGTSGLTADDAATTRVTIEKLRADVRAAEARLRVVQEERDKARALADQAHALARSAAVRRGADE